MTKISQILLTAISGSALFAGFLWFYYRRFVSEKSDEEPEEEENDVNLSKDRTNKVIENVIEDNERPTSGPATPGEHLVMVKGEDPEVAVKSVLNAAEKELGAEEERKNGGGDTISNNSTSVVNNKQDDGSNNATSNRTITQELIIQKDVVAALIGKRGHNIKGIQHNSNTRINFKEQTMENGDRICVVRGRPDDVCLAADMIQKFIATQPVTFSKNLLVPYTTVGRIIGRSGETIRSIQDMSKAKVSVESSRVGGGDDFNDDGEALNLVLIKGTQEQIEIAESLILEKVEEEKQFRSKIKGVASTRTSRRTAKNSSNSDASVQKEPSKQTLRPEGISEVFVSCVYHPNSFWLQLVGRDSIELDKLGESMTEYYTKEKSQPEQEFQIGDIVASPFQMDNKMYRAKIINLSPDVKKAEVEYVDYGDRREVEVSELRTLLPSFLELKFQAIEASLNLRKNEGQSKWTDEVITHFCDLCYCAQWHSITAKVKGFLTEESHDDESRNKTVVWVELMDKDINLGEQLINDGLASSVNTTNTK